jgi:hypothetical protein
VGLEERGPPHRRDRLEQVGPSGDEGRHAVVERPVDVGGLHEMAVFAGLARRHFGDEPLHVGEVVVHAAGRYAGALCHLLGRRAQHPRPVEREQGVDDGFAVARAPQDPSVGRHARHRAIQH